MNYHSTHKGGNIETKGFDIVLSIQQDTIPIQQPRDTTEETTEGIDPLFLIIERKSQEVEAIKEEVSTYKKQLVKKALPKQDTTCQICPKSEPLPLFAIVESSSLPKNTFDINPLYDKSFYLSNYSRSKPVFIETKDNGSNNKELLIKPESLGKGSPSIDWVFFPLIGLILILGYLRIKFPTQLSSLIRSTFFFFVANKLTKESSFHWGRFFVVLDVIYISSIPILTILVINHIGIGYDQNISLIALLTAIGLLGYKFYRFIFLKALGLVTSQSSAFETLRFNQLLYSRVMGIVLVPLLLVFAYSTQTLQTASLYTIALVFSLILIFSIIRTLQVFIFKGFSIFYLILYLCALEIIPVLVIVKEIFWE